MLWESIGTCVAGVGHLTCWLLRAIDTNMTLNGLVRDWHETRTRRAATAVRAPRAGRAAVPQQSDRATFWTPRRCEGADNSRARVSAHAPLQGSTTCTPV